jgi:hypothetical protein
MAHADQIFNIAFLTTNKVLDVATSESRATGIRLPLSLHVTALVTICRLICLIFQGLVFFALAACSTGGLPPIDRRNALTMPAEFRIETVIDCC